MNELEQSSESATKVRILLVDDLPENLELMQRMLRRLPELEILCVHSGKEAIDVSQQHELAMILMDVQMPVLNGIETAALIRQQDDGRHIPIIFITAHVAEESLIREAYQLKAVDFILKPLNYNILRAKVSFFVELFRKNKRLQAQAEQLLERERRERLLMEEQKALEEHGEALARLIKELQQANEALDEFAAIVSHDLQEPLRGIVGLSELLFRRCEENLKPQEKELLGAVISEGNRLKGMIRDLLTLARLGTEPTERTSVSLEEALVVAKNRLRQAIKEAQAEISYDELPTVECHPAHAAQLLQNLLGNALKFRSEQAPKIHVSARRDGDFWCVEVRDNGIGIPPELAGQVFVPFRRLHTQDGFPGTGIGLAICQKIVEKRGGKIWVEPTPQQEGTTFCFTLPAERPQG